MDENWKKDQEELRRLRAENLQLKAVLGELVSLKDGPRDAEYDRRKPLAWDLARSALS